MPRGQVLRSTRGRSRIISSLAPNVGKPRRQADPRYRCRLLRKRKVSGHSSVIVPRLVRDDVQVAGADVGVCLSVKCVRTGCVLERRRRPAAVTAYPADFTRDTSTTRTSQMEEKAGFSW